MTSTSESYGDPLVHPQVETYWGNVNPVGPRSCYDESKRFAEALTMAYHRTYSMRTNIARIFNTYGPRMKLNDGRVVPAFLDQALRGEPHHGFRRRLADAQFLLCERSGGRLVSSDAIRRALPGESGKSAGDDHPRIRGTHPASDRLEIRPVHQPLPQDDPRQRRPDITKAKRLLGWEPRVPLEEGLRETTEYFRKMQASVV